MRAYWIEDNDTTLEPACGEMRESFICIKIETENWYGGFLRSLVQGVIGVRPHHAAAGADEG